LEFWSLGDRSDTKFWVWLFFGGAGPNGKV